MESLNARLLLHAACVLHPPRAASVRQFLATALVGMNEAPSLAHVEERCERWLSDPPPSDDATALRHLVAEDLRPLLAALPRLPERVAAWSSPRQALESALATSLDALAALGVEVSRPALHVGDGLPAPYDHPSLAAVSVDRADATSFGLAPGIHFDRRRLAPLTSETVLAHVLVHVALGERSPEMLGRGLEEGIAEVLGALHVGSAVLGGEAAEKALLATRHTPSLTPHRASFLDACRQAALLHRRHGLGGLATLVAKGRGAVKIAEGALCAGRAEEVALPRAEPEPSLDARLDRVLSRGRPTAVGPLAFYLTRALEPGRSVAHAARELGVPEDRARLAVRELMSPAFVLVLSPEDRVLVDDLGLVLASGALRYRAADA